MTDKNKITVELTLDEAMVLRQDLEKMRHLAWYGYRHMMDISALQSVTEINLKHSTYLDLEVYLNLAMSAK